ncbi:MAG TPA: hypothetical protein VHL11_15505 [Phototrophicaceae bacterium]|nr:hypothetical protein [Phototrophicaceae bacterium]
MELSIGLYKTLPQNHIDRVTNPKEETGSSVYNHHYATWLSDSNTLAYVHPGSPYQSIRFVDVNTRIATQPSCNPQIGSALSAGALTAIDLSPDNSKFAVSYYVGYQDNQSSNTVIVILLRSNCSDLSNHLLDPDVKSYFDPRWSPDGQNIVTREFSRDRDTDIYLGSRIIVLDADDLQNEVSFIDVPYDRFYQSPDWSPTSNNELAFLSSDTTNLDQKIVFYSLLSNSFYENRQIDNAAGRIDWGKEPAHSYPPTPAMARCKSVKVGSESDLPLRLDTKTNFPAFLTLPEDSRIVAVGKSIVQNLTTGQMETWLVTYRYIDSDGIEHVITHGGFPAAGWVRDTDEGFDFSQETSPNRRDACDDDPAVNDPSQGFTNIEYYLPTLDQPTPTPSFTPSITTTPEICDLQVTYSGGQNYVSYRQDRISTLSSLSGHTLQPVANRWTSTIRWRELYLVLCDKSAEWGCWVGCRFCLWSR